MHNSNVPPQKSQLWRGFGALLSQYWLAASQRRQLALLVLLLLITAGIVGLEMIFSYWYNYFYNALQEYQQRQLFILLGVFVGIAIVYIILEVLRYAVGQILALRWRLWLTNMVLEQWLSQHNYYYLEQFYVSPDNPEQRLQEDIDILVNQSLELLVVVVQALATVVAFVYILWTLSGVLSLNIFGVALNIHGYLVWLAVLSAVIGSVITYKLGRPLRLLNIKQQQCEANLRFAATDLRANSEVIALSDGAAHSQATLWRHLHSAISNWRLIIAQQKLLLWFSAGYNQISVIIPILLVLPGYLHKKFLFGGLMQTCKAFGEIQGALSLVVNDYPAIAKWHATLERLVMFQMALKAARQPQVGAALQQARHDHAGIKLASLNIYTPDRRILLSRININIAPQEATLIYGHSGVGKTVLVKTIAGLWPFAQGQVLLPQAKVLYLPERSYFPAGSLAHSITYPQLNGIAVDEELLAKLLRRCGLSKLVEFLALHENNWSYRLALGDLQRLSVVRILLTRPAWVILDESHSALSSVEIMQLYQLIKEQNPNITIVSLAKQLEMPEFYQQTIDLAAWSHELL